MTKVSATKGQSAAQDVIIAIPLGRSFKGTLRALNREMLRAYQNAETPSKEFRLSYIGHSVRCDVLTVRYRATVGPRTKGVGMWSEGQE